MGEPVCAFFGPGILMSGHVVPRAARFRPAACCLPLRLPVPVLAGIDIMGETAGLLARQPAAPSHSRSCNGSCSMQQVRSALRLGHTATGLCGILTRFPFDRRAPDEVRGEPSPAAKLAKISPPPLIALYISPLRRGRGAHKKAASGSGNQFRSRRPAAVSPGINLSHLPVSLFAPAAGQVGAQESRACEFSSQARPLKSRML